MRRVIRFTRLRYVMAGLSLSIIIFGIILFAVRGFNLGVDFRGGVSLQWQIAPVAMTLDAPGLERVQVSSHTGQTGLASGSAIEIAVTTAGQTTTQDFPFTQYPTVGELSAALQTVPGVKVKLAAEASVASSRLFTIEAPVDIAKGPLVLNYPLGAADTPYVTIQTVRTAVAGLGQPEVQTLGRLTDQQFVVKIGVPAGDNGDFRQTIESKVRGMLATAFPPEQLLLRRTDYVGPKLAGELVTQTISVILVSLVLMLVYLSFRFEFPFAFAAVVCIIQDCAVMTTFVLISGMEMSTSIIAALLTIIGYSVNDTIVIFDRVRENTRLMRDLDDASLFDTSISQTLGRTIITSFTVALSTAAIFVFTTGSLKDFALLLMIGVVEGTWSTIYIASPLVLAWHSMARRISKRREARKFGGQPGERPAERRVAEAAVVEEADLPEAEEGAPAASAPGPSTDGVGSGGEAKGVVIRQQPSRKKKRKR